MLSLYDIANRPTLLAKMTLQEGENLTYEQQLARLESMMARRRQRVTNRTVNPLDTL